MFLFHPHMLPNQEAGQGKRQHKREWRAWKLDCSGVPSLNPDFQTLGFLHFPILLPLTPISNLLYLQLFLPERWPAAVFSAW